MMRIAWIIVLMAAVAVGVVQLRARQTAARAEMFRLEARRLKVRRRLWDQQLRLGGSEFIRPTGAPARRPAVELVAPGESPAGHHMAQRE